MKNNIIFFLKKYWILSIFILTFTIFILPICFQNNDNLNVVAAEHVDSGSILSSILQLNDKSKPNSFYNQNLPYHTIYGFPYNSIVFWSFSLLKINTIDNASIYPLTAKLLNFLFALLSIVYLYQLSGKILKYNFSKIILFSLFLIFPPFIHYVFHIKSDILGLLFSIVSLNFLFDFLQNPKNNKNIIKANIFGGLSILCKQPHIFILFPLFIGFILTLKGNFKKRVTNFLTVYLYSGIIFLFLFFLIHPYAFIETKAFLLKQKSLFGMTAASYTDNLNYWLPTFINDPLLFITAFTPFVFLLLNLFKKFHNKITLFLSLISIYLIIYILWLTFKVGPMRFIAYFIPILPFSILLFSYIIDLSFDKLFHSKPKISKIFFLIIVISLFLLSIKTIKNTLIQTKNTIDSVYIFKRSETYKATQKMEKEFFKNQFNNQSIIYSISLPINETLYKKSDNTWQGLTTSDYLFIDFTVYWEKPYEYWEKIAKQNGLNKEMLFIKNLNKEKNIILFYR